ncbi:MAG: trypsin-like peptidase domain-containing protein [Planctomycetota bacterium]
MMQRGFVLLALGCGLGLLFATYLQPRAASGEDAPGELMRAPSQPTTQAKDLSRPFIAATKKVRPAVVQVLNFQRDRRGQLRPASSGSGFFFSKEGHLLTNRHVIQGAQQLAVKLLDGTTLTNIKVLGSDPRSDVAVLRVQTDKEFAVASLGDSDKVEVGEWVIAIGAPFKLASSVSAGVVSARGRTGVLASDPYDQAQFSEAFIQTDAALNPGNSGGPLINLDGQVIGINTAIETGNQIRANVGIGFAIPINLVRTIAISLIERGVAKRGWLGVQIRKRVGVELEQEFGLDLPGGLVVEFVEKESPAWKAGLRKNDVIVDINGRPMLEVKALGARLAQAGPGGRLKIDYYRNKQKTSTTAILATEPTYTFGIKVADLDDERAREAGIDPSIDAVVITDVEPDTPAATGPNRLYPGDVIVRIDTRALRVRVRNARDFERALQTNPTAIKLTLAAKGQLYEVFLARSER